MFSSASRRPSRCGGKDIRLYHGENYEKCDNEHDNLTGLYEEVDKFMDEQLKSDANKISCQVSENSCQYENHANAQFDADKISRQVSENSCQYENHANAQFDAISEITLPIKNSFVLDSQGIFFKTSCQPTSEFCNQGQPGKKEKVEAILTRCKYCNKISGIELITSIKVPNVYLI